MITMSCPMWKAAPSARDAARSRRAANVLLNERGANSATFRSIFGTELQPNTQTNQHSTSRPSLTASSACFCSSGVSSAFFGNSPKMTTSAGAPGRGNFQDSRCSASDIPAVILYFIVGFARRSQSCQLTQDRRGPEL
jgi:hypothetical protein